ncbi:hypothetical protein FQR65_LT11203 [Abscondita terminalis]|nr:hypothetical protein FQR65_LT11203 [Abscondita terminalis]
MLLGFYWSKYSNKIARPTRRPIASLAPCARPYIQGDKDLDKPNPLKRRRDVHQKSYERIQKLRCSVRFCKRKFSRLKDGSMKMSFSNDHGPWEANNEYKGNEVPNYHGDISSYGTLWDPHHCLAGQNPSGLGGYPDIITAFNTELAWQRQQCGGLVANRLSRNGSPNVPVQSQKKPRRRVATIAQRRAANIRERRRMFNLNEAFDKLRRKVPTFAYEKRLSRIETLRLAITYISFMTELLHGTSPDLKNNDIYPQREYIPYGLIN